MDDSAKPGGNDRNRAMEPKGVEQQLVERKSV